MSTHRAKKRFGQHFLRDESVIERTLRAMALEPSDTVVEIGPGLGALTLPLLQQLPQLTVVELDRDVLPHLRQKAGAKAAQLTVIEADALTVDYAALAPAGGQLRLVGNLPYNISTPLLFHLLDQAAAVRDMHFMLQKEVVERLCAGPGDDHYGRLSVMLAAQAQADHLFDVGPECFDPPPQVDSAIVRITPREPGFVVADAGAFERVVSAGFAQRRKTLGNALKTLMTPDTIRAAGVDPLLRAERVSPTEFAALAAALSREGPH